MLLTLLSAIAAAQPEAPTPPTIYPELGEESVLSGELGCADVVDCPPRAGFMPFARLQGGQFWIEEEDRDGGFASQSVGIGGTSIPSANQHPFANENCVYVPLEDSSNVMMGYLDVQTTQYGDSVYVYSGGDGIADDLDYDGMYGSDGFDIRGPDNSIERYYGFDDYDDLAVLPTVAESVHIREELRIESVELSLQHLYDSGGVNSQPAWRIGANGWGINLDAGALPFPSDVRQPIDPNSGWLSRWLRGFNHAHYVSYGVRAVRLVDEWELETSGGTLLGTSAHTAVDHLNIGPQITLGRTSRSGRWLFDLSGSLVLGWGQAKFSQSSQLFPDAQNALLLNVPLNATSQEYSHQDREDFLATYAELDFTTSYFLTSHWTIDLTARAFVLGEHFSAEDHIVWSLPDFGISESKQSHTFAGGNLFVGASYVW